MSIWRATSIKQTPEIELASWRIYEVESELLSKKTRHFVGYNLTEREGRVSSAIVEFDPVAMIGRTSSGRIYKLVGDPGTSQDASYVWSQWCKINQISSIEEVNVEKAQA